MSKGPWELIDGPIAGDIETLNRATQVNVTNALVVSLLDRQTRRHTPSPLIPGEAALLRLHEAGTRFLLRKPGQYRLCDVHVEDVGRDFILWGAPRRHVKAAMRRFFADLAQRWTHGDALDVAAFALWRIASIHPFLHGNGRTANAFSYACLCLKLGGLLPGRETMMTFIPADPDPYLDALTVAHKSAGAATGSPDLSALKAHLDALLWRQTRSVSQSLGRHAG